MLETVSVLAYGFGKGAGQHSAGKAPFGGYRTVVDGLNKLGIMSTWKSVVPREHRMPSQFDEYKDVPQGLKNATAVIDSVTALAKNVGLTMLKDEHFPLIFGGDHTQGLGSFKGMALAETTKALLSGQIALHIVDEESIDQLKDMLKQEINNNNMQELASIIEAFVLKGNIHENDLNNFLNSIHIIWFDAHGDYNSPDITPSGNAHGMPVAAIVGLGDERLNNVLSSWIRINPNNIHFIAVRDLDIEEEKLMLATGTNIHYMPEIVEKGLDVVLNEIIEKMPGDSKNPIKLHLSFDIDGIDAKHVPATGTPVGVGSTRNTNIGPNLSETLKAFTGIADKVVAIDISESNFRIDRDPTGITLETVNLLIQSFFGNATPNIIYDSHADRMLNETARHNPNNDSTSFYIPYSMKM